MHIHISGHTQADTESNIHQFVASVLRLCWCLGVYVCVFTGVKKQRRNPEANNAGPQSNIVGPMSTIILVSA